MAVNEKIRIKIKGYEHAVVDAAAAKIVEAVKRSGCTGFRSYPTSYRQRGNHYPQSCTQVQV